MVIELKELTVTHEPGRFTEGGQAKQVGEIEVALRATFRMGFAGRKALELQSGETTHWQEGIDPCVLHPL